MPTKIRLQRHGKKSYAYYHVVIADSRAPRDGKYIEKIGIYNPNTNPATIEINEDKALEWMQVGAIPTTTVFSILKYRGVVYKNHLLKGVAKGAFSEEEAEKRFEKWKLEKEAKISSKVNNLAADVDREIKKRFSAEEAINEKRAKEIAARNIKEVEKAQMEEAVVETVVEAVENAEVSEEVKVVEEIVEEVVEEVVVEAPAKEAPKAETEKAEAKEEEKPKEEPKEPKA